MNIPPSTCSVGDNDVTTTPESVSVNILEDHLTARQWPQCFIEELLAHSQPPDIDMRTCQSYSIVSQFRNTDPRPVLSDVIMSTYFHTKWRHYVNVFPHKMTSLCQHISTQSDVIMSTIITFYRSAHGWKAGDMLEIVFFVVLLLGYQAACNIFEVFESYLGWRYYWDSG